jgi:hypothetical protein
MKSKNKNGFRIARPTTQLRRAIDHLISIGYRPINPQHLDSVPISEWTRFDLAFGEADDIRCRIYRHARSENWRTKWVSFKARKAIHNSSWSANKQVQDGGWKTSDDIKFMFTSVTPYSKLERAHAKTLAWYISQ